MVILASVSLLHGKRKEKEMQDDLTQWAEEGGRMVRLMVDPDRPGAIRFEILDGQTVLAGASLANFRAERIGPFITARLSEREAEIAAACLAREEAAKK